MLKHEKIMKEHPEIAAWLRDRPFNTQRGFAEKLMTFSQVMNISPEAWRKLDKFKARDLAWKYVEPLKASKSGTATVTLAALKNWFRNLNGEQLPLDSKRGGKHNVRVIAKKATIEHIPSKEEIYRIVDMAGNLRDKAILLMLFRSGIRVNALIRLTYGMIEEQLSPSQEIVTLRITRDIDTKLSGAGIPFYYTFLNGEGAITLKQYCQVAHKKSKPETPLFYTCSTKHPISETWIWRVVKKCVGRAGMDPKSMWVHSFRKAFRKVVSQASIDDDSKEEMMGHVLKGSREAYFDRTDVELLQAAYEKCHFEREVPKSEVSKLIAQLEDEQSKRSLNEARMDRLEKEGQETRQLLKEMLEKK